ncbi:MAG: FkbM family methyltransferase [Desulfurococcaceae archaeon]
MTNNSTNNDSICKHGKPPSIHRYCSKLAHLLGIDYYKVKVNFARSKLEFLIPTSYFDAAFNNLDHVLYSCDYFAIRETRPSRGGRVLDAGAFLGFYTVASLIIMENDGYIYSFEPNVNVLPFLYENIRLNKAVNTKVFPFAICPSNGTRRIFIAEYPAVSSMIKNHVEYHSRIIKELEVKCVKLSSLLNHFEFIQIMKLDIEGLELDVLKEALEDLWRVKGIIVEVHTDVVDTDEIETTLEKAGFKKFFIFASSEMPYQSIIHAVR